MFADKYEIITNQDLHVSMPVAGVLRVTDGHHNQRYAVNAKFRKRPSRVDGELNRIMEWHFTLTGN